MKLGNLILVVSLVGMPLLVALSGYGAAGKGTHFLPPKGWTAHVPIHVSRFSNASQVGGYSPDQLKAAYGLSQLNCTSSNSCGSGETIAIVDAYSDPTIANDLSVFSTEFGLPQCTVANGCFTLATPFGVPQQNSGWDLEIALDVEWAHAMAPGAKILLVEANSSSFSDLMNAVNYAKAYPGVHVVSMSWGGSEFPSETAYDNYFNASAVSFVASSGDSGNGVEWPAASPYVIGVGGTTLNLSSSGAVLSETAWSGSGGGISTYEAEPQYQEAVQSSGGRGVPDVAYDANPNTGVPVYESFGYTGYKGWIIVGGTSMGAPQWSAIIAIIDSRRASALSSQGFLANSQIYAAASGASYTANYNDIVSGSNGNCGAVCDASQGYDFVTGLGSPHANSLVPFIASAGNVTTTTTSSTSSSTSLSTTSSTVASTSTSTTSSVSTTTIRGHGNGNGGGHGKH